MISFRSGLFISSVLPVLLVVSASVCAESTSAESPERTLHNAGLSEKSEPLLAFFHARARMNVESEQLRQLLARFAVEDQSSRAAATAELLGLGSLVLQTMRQSANDLDRPDVAARAARCLPWLEGTSSHQLLIAAAQVLAERKPPGTAAALLAYLPFADNAEVVNAINAALAAVAAPAGKPDAALLRGLSDALGVRRAAAGVALCKAVPPQQVPDVRKLLKDPAAAVRRRAALALAEANDAEAIPVLIDLLAELSAEQRQPIEERLTRLAGEWAPILQFATDDEVSRGVRRDAWASWWRRTDGPLLLAALGKYTLTHNKRRQIEELLARLGSDDFSIREDASRQLQSFGRLVLPHLRQTSKDRDAEVARRAKLLIERIENGPEARLPLAVPRLLAVRKPAGAVETLLAYLPFAEDEVREEEVRKALSVLAQRDGKLDLALRRGLTDPLAKVRAIAAEALIQGGGTEGRAAVGNMLREDKPSVRRRVALALVQVGEREAIAVLIELLPLLSGEEYGQVEDTLYQVAGETAPDLPTGTADDKKKCRDAWAAWWKVNAKRVDLSRPADRLSLGYTLICNFSSVEEVDRRGKTRWRIDNAGGPIDALMLPNQRVLIAEWQANRVSERDLKGNVLWELAGLAPGPANIQRLANGNTFIAIQNTGIVEVDRSKKEIYRINNLAGLFAAYRTRQGVIVCLIQPNQCLFLDKTGKQLKSFNLKHPINGGGCLDVLPDGRMLIAASGVGKVMEYDSSGKLLREWDVPAVSTATGLTNGHLLVASYNNNRVAELDRSGKVVWEHTNIQKAYRARRR